MLTVYLSTCSKLSSSIARYIGANVWKNGDIGDVISIGKLVGKSDGPKPTKE